MADKSPSPDQLDQLELSPAQMKLLLNDTRMAIIDLLTERPATTSELADTLDQPKGTIGHHCKALADGGLIHVVRTEKVRAMEARYYGRTAKLFLFAPYQDEGTGLDDVDLLVGRAFEELRRSKDIDPGWALPAISTSRYARIPVERAAEWERRLADLADEFRAEPKGGETTFGLIVGLFPTARKALPDE